MFDALARDLAIYIAVSVVFCALTGLGSLVGHLLEPYYRPTRLARLALFVGAGWGIAALLSAAAAVAGFDQAWLARALLVLGLLLLLPFRTNAGRQQVQTGLDLVLLLALVAPMGLLVAGTPAVGFDEFTQWLPNTRYLVEHSHYWLWPDWIGASSKPGYPNGSAIIALFSDQMIGPEVEAPFKTFVVMLLGAFGAVLADLAVRRTATGAPRAGLSGPCVAGLLAAGCLVSFLDPLLDPRISYTAYTDTPTALVLAIGGLMAVRGVDAAYRGDDKGTAGCFAWVGLLLLTLLFLRTTNLVLIAAIALASAILLMPARVRTLRRWAGWALLLIGPAAIGEVVWSSFLHLARIGPDIAARPIAAWNWTAPVTVARIFLRDLREGNPVLSFCIVGIVLIAAVAGAAGWRRPDATTDEGVPAPRLFVALTGIVCACFVMFLAWAYTAVFSPAEVAAAASLWRYLSELGPLVLLTVCSVVAGLVPKPLWTESRRPALIAAGLCVCALVLLPIAGHRSYSLDCRYPDVVATREVVARLRPALEPFAAAAPKRARVAVVNSTMGDWMAYAMAFDLHWPASDSVVRFRTVDESLAATEVWAWDEGLDAVLDLTPLDRATLRRQRMIPSISLHGRPAARGEPWPVLATAEPKPLPSCSMWSRH